MPIDIYRSVGKAVWLHANDYIIKALVVAELQVRLNLIARRDMPQPRR